MRFGGGNARPDRRVDSPEAGPDSSALSPSQPFSMLRTAFKQGEHHLRNRPFHNYL